MRILVSEYVCGGGWNGHHQSAGSLAVEGRAMLTAFIEDLLQVPGVRVVTTWDPRFGAHSLSGARVLNVGNFSDSYAAAHPKSRRKPRMPSYHFSLVKLAQRCTGTFLIAPESNGILFDLCHSLERTGGKLLNSTSTAVRTCTDKLSLATVLEKAGVRTIPTRPLTWESASILEHSGDPLQFPLVVKPRDGAGSQDNHLIRDWRDFERLRTFRGSEAYIRQPFATGRAVSVMLLIPEPGAQPVPFPVAEQFLSDDGRFFYRGGRIPARGVDHGSIQAAAIAACACVPGLRGYVGADLIYSEEDPLNPIVVEINPRLTTSYLGYRALAKENLANRMLPGRRPLERVRWRAGAVEFDAAGNTRLIAPRT